MVKICVNCKYMLINSLFLEYVEYLSTQFSSIIFMFGMRLSLTLPARSLRCIHVVKVLFCSVLAKSPRQNVLHMDIDISPMTSEKRI